MTTVVFSGGVGGARFLSGLVQVLPEEEIIVISNTGDDSEFFGLYVSPDIDIVMYTLSDMVNPETGWGLAGDSFHTLQELAVLGCDTWFNLGDKDLATHILRTQWMRQGEPLSAITARLTKARGLGLTILPMSDQRVETVFYSGERVLSFQEYMVKYRWQVPVDRIGFRGIENARPAPGVLEAIQSADRIILAPSNPFISIGAILAVEEIRRALVRCTAKVAAISPIVGGEAIKGPAAALMRGFGYAPGPCCVAELYQDFLDLMIIDQADAQHLPAISAMGMEARATDTMMSSVARKRALAQTTLRLMEELG